MTLFHQRGSGLDGQSFVVCDFEEDDGDENDTVEHIIEVTVPPAPLGSTLTLALLCAIL